MSSGSNSFYGSSEACGDKSSTANESGQSTTPSGSLSGLKRPPGMSVRMSVPKHISKAEMQMKLNAGNITYSQLHEIANDFRSSAGMTLAITGSFALQLHAGRPFHRPINDIDFVVANLAELKANLEQSAIFDASNISVAEDNGWVIHRPSRQIFDVLQAGGRFGSLENIEYAGGLPVISFNELVNSLKRRDGNSSDLDFAKSL